MLHLQLHRRCPPRALLGGGVAGHGDQRDSLAAVMPLTQQDVPIGGGGGRRRRKAVAQMADPAVAEEVGVALGVRHVVHAGTEEVGVAVDVGQDLLSSRCLHLIVLRLHVGEEEKRYKK